MIRHLTRGEAATLAAITNTVAYSVDVSRNPADTALLVTFAPADQDRHELPAEGVIVYANGHVSSGIRDGYPPVTFATFADYMGAPS